MMMMMVDEFYSNVYHEMIENEADDGQLCGSNACTVKGFTTQLKLKDFFQLK